MKLKLYGKNKSKILCVDKFKFKILTRGSFLNMFLNGLNLIEDDKTQNKWNLYEICPLNFATIFNNFPINIDLWKKNTNKLEELFNRVTDDSSL